MFQKENAKLWEEIYTIGLTVLHKRILFAAAFVVGGVLVVLHRYHDFVSGMLFELPPPYNVAVQSLVFLLPSTCDTIGFVTLQIDQPSAFLLVEIPRKVREDNPCYSRDDLPEFVDKPEHEPHRNEHASSLKTHGQV